jgi:hypothetical protein
LGLIGDAVALLDGEGDDLGVVVVADACEGIKDGACEFVCVTDRAEGWVSGSGGFDALFPEVSFGALEATDDGNGHGMRGIPMIGSGSDSGLFDVLPPGFEVK